MRLCLSAYDPRFSYIFFFFHYTATTEIYTYLHTLSLHGALPISAPLLLECGRNSKYKSSRGRVPWLTTRSEEHTSELQSLMRISYAVFCLKKKKQTTT